MSKQEARRAFWLPLSLRTRLTLSAVLVFAVIQVGLALCFLVIVREAIDNYFNSRMEVRALRLLELLGTAPQRASREELVLRVQADQSPLLRERIVAALYAAQGGEVASSHDGLALGDDPLVRGALAENRPLVALKRVPIVRTEGRGRVIALPVRGDDLQRYVLVLAGSDDQARSMMALARSAVLWTLPLGIVAAAGAGWFIAGVAVAPLKRIGTVVGGLSPQTLSAPIPQEPAPPEVAATTAELERARERLDAGFRSQERFMSNVSHELKTPIAIILTECQTLSASGVPDSMRAFVDSTREEMRRLGRLVDSFLTLTNVRAGHAGMMTRRYMVNELVLDSIEHCAFMASEHRVPLEPGLLSAHDEVDLCVRGEPELLRTMIDNLVRNAIRIGPRGTRVNIGARRVDGGVVIGVRDQGPGIPEAVLHHLFDRAPPSPHEPYPRRGYGFGLEIAKAIAELHGGSISVENLPDAGCEFRVFLPTETTDNGAELPTRADS